MFVVHAKHYEHLLTIADTVVHAHIGLSQLNAGLKLLDLLEQRGREKLQCFNRTEHNA